MDSASVDQSAPARTASDPKPFGFHGEHLGYRPALDGLRGVSILAVMVVHTERVNSRAAFIAVVMFFVLSGFLITSLLIEEWDRFGRISLRRFYIRRALRLLPALAVMLAVFVLFYWMTAPRSKALDVTVDALVAFFYSSNWTLAVDFHQPNLFGHAWSLSIEEQFYACWPLLLLFLLRTSPSRRSLLNWVLLGVVVVIFERILLVFTGSSGGRILYGTDTRADALLLGCAIAVAFSAGILPSIENHASHPRAPETEASAGPKQRLAYFLSSIVCVPMRFCVEAVLPRQFTDNQPQLSRNRKFTVLLPWVATASFAGLVFFSEFSQFSYEADLCIGYSLISLCAAGVFLHVIVATRGVFHWILTRSWLACMGKISYGLYLWHYPIFGTVQIQRWPAATELTAEFALTAIVVLASYHLLEKPLLGIKSRFARVN